MPRLRSVSNNPGIEALLTTRVVMFEGSVTDRVMWWFWKRFTVWLEIWRAAEHCWSPVTIFPAWQRFDVMTQIRFNNNSSSVLSVAEPWMETRSSGKSKMIRAHKRTATWYISFTQHEIILCFYLVMSVTENHICYHQGRGAMWMRPQSVWSLRIPVPVVEENRCRSLLKL